MIKREKDARMDGGCTPEPLLLRDRFFAVGGESSLLSERRFNRALRSWSRPFRAFYAAFKTERRTRRHFVVSENGISIGSDTFVFGAKWSNFLGTGARKR